MSITCITHNPIGAAVVLLVIIYSFMYLNQIEFKNFFTPNGFALYFKDKPWIVYTIISIILYAVLCTINQMVDPDTVCDMVEKDRSKIKRSKINKKIQKL